MSKPVGINELTFDKESRELTIVHVDYILEKRDEKIYAIPEGESRNSVSIEDGKIILNTFFPLEDTPCPRCGVYGLVKTLPIGQYKCANCGEVVVLSPNSKLDIRQV